MNETSLGTEVNSDELQLWKKNTKCSEHVLIDRPGLVKISMLNTVKRTVDLDDLVTA